MTLAHLSPTLSLQDTVDQLLAGLPIRGVKWGLLGELAPIPGGAVVLQQLLLLLLCMLTVQLCVALGRWRP